MHTMPGFRRRQILGELRAQIEMREPLDEVLSWLRTTEATVVEAVEMVEQAIGLPREEAEMAFIEHPDWRRLVQLMGGFDGERLHGSVPEPAA
jgi:hypothetical protein